MTFRERIRYSMPLQIRRHKMAAYARNIAAGMDSLEARRQADLDVSAFYRDGLTRMAEDPAVKHHFAAAVAVARQYLKGMPNV